MSVNTVSVTVELVPETCCSCGVVFGMTAETKKRRKEDRESFYCPNGHGQHYTGPTEADKLRKELAATTARLDRACADANWQREEAGRQKRAAAAAKGAVTKIKRRVAGGVCPCCNRYFPDVHRHMSAKHPGEQRETGVRAFEETGEAK